MRVALLRDGAGLHTLEVADDGVGLAADVDPRATSTLGLQIVNILADQLGGRVSFDRESGTRVRVTFDATRA